MSSFVYGYPGYFLGASWILWLLVLVVLFFAFAPHYVRGGKFGWY